MHCLAGPTVPAVCPSSSRTKENEAIRNRAHPELVGEHEVSYQLQTEPQRRAVGGAQVRLWYVRALHACEAVVCSVGVVLILLPQRHQQVPHSIPASQALACGHKWRQIYRGRHGGACRGRVVEDARRALRYCRALELCHDGRECPEGVELVTGGQERLKSTLWCPHEQYMHGPHLQERTSQHSRDDKGARDHHIHDLGSSPAPHILPPTTSFHSNNINRC